MARRCGIWLVSYLVCIPDFPRQALHTLYLPGMCGDLELMTTWPGQMPRHIALICHPHPLHGGTMHNKVVTTLAKTFDKAGLATVRFNYRGVGRSAGCYGDIHGEIADLQTVKKWVETVLPQQRFCLAGFSFGSFIAASVTNQDDNIDQLVTVAPAVNHVDFGDLLNIRCPWLVIHGDQDEVVSFEAVCKFASNPPSPLQFVTLADAGHFFHGKLLQLQQAVDQNTVNL